MLQLDQNNYPKTLIRLLKQRLRSKRKRKRKKRRKKNKKRSSNQLPKRMIFSEIPQPQQLMQQSQNLNQQNLRKKNLLLNPWSFSMSRFMRCKQIYWHCSRKSKLKSLSMVWFGTMSLKLCRLHLVWINFKLVASLKMPKLVLMTFMKRLKLGKIWFNPLIQSVSRNCDHLDVCLSINTN